MNRKLHMDFVNIEKMFDRAPRKVIEWATRKKGLLEVNVKAVTSLHQRAKTKVRVGSELLQKLWVKVVLDFPGWCTSKIRVVTGGFCNCSGGSHRMP